MYSLFLKNTVSSLNCFIAERGGILFYILQPHTPKKLTLFLFEQKFDTKRVLYGILNIKPIRKEEIYIETMERTEPLCPSGPDCSRYVTHMRAAFPFKHYGSHDGAGFLDALSDSSSRQSRRRALRHTICRVFLFFLFYILPKSNPIYVSK